MSLSVTLDGIEVSQVSIRGSVTRRLNRPSMASITIPMDYAIGGAGSRLKVTIDGYLRFHGFVLDCETDTGEDVGYTVYNALDPMELWQWRPVRDDDGDFSLPSIIETYITGPQIIQRMLLNSINAGAGPPSDAEGPLFLTLGTFESGGVSLTGAPTDWPQTMMQLASLLVSTGEVDIVITPTDPGGGVMGRVDCWNGNFGTDRSASIIFRYGQAFGESSKNVRRLRWNEDMSNLANKIWYYGGPRIGTAQDPAGDQHWCWNIQGDDPGLAYPPGGQNSPPGSAVNNQLGVRRILSQNSLGPSGTGYGVRMDIKIFDALSDLCLGPGSIDPGRELYRRLWQIESWIRAVPRQLIHITPIAGTQIGTFDIGDLVGVQASADVRGGFSGAQRVYEYTISWDEDGPFELSELQTSPTGEGI